MNTPDPTPSAAAVHRLLRIDGAGVADARGLLAAPGTLLFRLDDAAPPHAGRAFWHARATLLAAGAPADIDRALRTLTRADGHTPDLVRIDARDRLLVPGLVNAHAHLDLSHIPPVEHPPGAGFAPFARVVIAGRAQDEPGVAASARRGIDLSLAGGVVAVGDVAGPVRGRPTLTPALEMLRAGLWGRSYIEFFARGTPDEERQRTDALGEWFDAALAEWTRAGGEAPSPLHAPARLGLGISPHATYSVSRRGYGWALRRARRSGLALMTHLAEHADERRFIASGDGPVREFYEALSAWHDGRAWDVGDGRSPVAWLTEVLRGGDIAAAHVNDCDDADLQTLAETGARVLYCPRSSAYFRNHEVFGPHRYRDMLRAGVTVALGTDSLINLPAAHPGSAARLTPLDDARLLLARDGDAGGVDPVELLAMLTTRGARALALDERAFGFGEHRSEIERRSESERRSAGVTAIALTGSGDPLRAAFAGDGAPELLLLGK